MRRSLGLLLAICALLVSACFPPGIAAPATGTLTPSANLPNPASVFCTDQGFRLEIRSDAAGNQSGVCHFPDGSECDEWAFFRGECGPANQASPTPPETASTPAATAAPAATAVTEGAGATTYTSTALGISFDYLPQQDGQTIRVLEQGDKIFVYPTTMDPAAGQWVQVLPKDAGESLVDAITRTFMSGYPAENCQVAEVAHPLGGDSPDPNFEYAGIVIPRIEGEDMEVTLGRWQTCPQPYTVVGGIGYFQADAAHPTQFLFFSIGQYGIMAGENLPWQETIRFK
jgi:putative hemolysin